MAAAETLRVGNVLMDPSAGCLRGSDGAEIALRPKSFDLLAVLARNPRRTLSRDELLDAVWSGVTVTDESVTQCVREVRRAIGDPDGRLLRTVARRGYRLDLEIVPATPAGDRDTAARTSAEPSVPSPVTPAARLDKPSIAVLAFDNMSSDREQEFLSDGLADDIITELSRNSYLFVIARNSSFTYKGRAADVKQIAHELGVRYVLEGSVRHAAGRIRVNTQLIDAENGAHLWAERYDRDIVDIFAVQTEVAAAVTIAIVPAIGNAEQQRAMRRPPANLDAWGAYQRGLWHLGLCNADNNVIAETFFRQAIELDPAFSRGYTGLALAVDLAGTAFETRNIAEARSVAESLARRAIALDDADAEAHACFAGCLLGRGDHHGARAEAEHALAISPNLASAHGALGAVLLFSGRSGEALPLIEACLRRDPRSPERGLSLGQLAIAHYLRRDYAAAVEAAHRAIRTSPSRDPSYYRWLAAALGQLDRAAEAREALHHAATFGPADFDLRVHDRAPWMRPDDHAQMIDGLRKAGWAAEDLPGNTIRVTATGLVADRLRTSPLMDAFHARYPHLRLELIISDRCLDLSKGEADLAIRAGEPEDQSLIRHKIADVAWAVYASKSYIARHGAPECLEDIEHHFIVACNCEGPADKWLRSVAPRGTVVARCDTGSDQLLAVKSGAGLAFLPAYQRDDDLVRVIDDIGPVTPFYLLMHRDMQRTPRVRAFADFAATEINAFRALLSG